MKDILPFPSMNGTEWIWKFWVYNWDTLYYWRLTRIIRSKVWKRYFYFPTNTQKLSTGSPTLFFKFNLSPILTYWMSHPKWPHHPLNLASRTLYHAWFKLVKHKKFHLFFFTHFKLVKLLLVFIWITNINFFTTSNNLEYQ